MKSNWLVISGAGNAVCGVVESSSAALFQLISLKAVAVCQL